MNRAHYMVYKFSSVMEEPLNNDSIIGAHDLFKMVELRFSHFDEVHIS